MKAVLGSRGQPLAALALVLGGWVGWRAVVWYVPMIASETAFAANAGVTPTEPRPAGPPAARPPFRAMPSASARGMGVLRQPARPWPASSGRAELALAFAMAEPRLGGPSSQFSTSQAAGGVAAPSGVALAGDAAQAPFYPAGREPAARARRWSGDGWMLLRGGGGATLAGGVSPATYGASQAGAVLRYRLAPGSGHRPAAYLRGTAALNGAREQDLALGISARPFPAVPVIAAAELRVSRQSAGLQVRPAAMLITELPLFALPAGMRGEAYGQAGYVGGRFATAFADGQFRVDRPVVRIGAAALRAGAGAWGGAQKGASRLDAGPGATIAFGLGRGGSARIAFDWRFRVAGNAAPSSGPALTLSAGF